MTDDIRYAIALSCLPHLSQAAALHLCRELGGAAAVYAHRHDLAAVLPDASPRLVEAVQHWDDALRRADEEAAFLERYHISALPFGAADYPARLADCADAPLVLYYRGSADLVALRVVSMVGTRRCTAYGRDLCEHFVRRLAECCPQALVVSGLAYGIDICAHRAALDAGLDTVGVLAHGLEKIYPTAHRDTAQQMVEQGGLLTEYRAHAAMDRSNFVRRNRIVAGLCDAVVVVESASSGGSLITAAIAQSYGRQVFAFPGPVGAPGSEGCNHLIRDNAAALITSADDFVSAMGWAADAQLRQARADGIERSLFPELSDVERMVLRKLDETGDLQLNQLAVATGLSVGTLAGLLFVLETQGLVRSMAGGTYHLIK